MRTRLLALLAALHLFVSPAFAASGITQITVLDAGGTSRNINVVSSTGAVGGNLQWINTICDQTTLTQCAGVNSSGQMAIAGPVTNAGTFAVQATLQATATTAIGKVDPNTIATWGLAAIGGGTNSPTNALAAGCQYNASPPTFTTGDVGGVQCTIAGSLHTTVDNTNANGPAASANSSPVIQPIAAHAVSASAGVTSLVAKASAGNIYGFNCTGVAGGAAGFCVAYNGSSAPGTGALTAANVLDFCYYDTTARGCSLSHVGLQIAASTGVVILVTSATTPFTYTTGTNTAAIEADYN